MDESRHSTESSNQNFQDLENRSKELQDKENSPPKFKVDGNHQCELCGKVFAVESRLKRHVATHTGADKVQCEICSRILGARDQYVVHMKRLHGVDVTRNTGPANKKKCFSCEVCGKIFVNGYKLRRHMNVHTGEEKSQCTICFKWIASKQALAKHIEKHDQKQSENQSIECRQCNIIFPTIQQILEHMEIHSESDKFVCSMCATNRQPNCDKTAADMADPTADMADPTADKADPTADNKKTTDITVDNTFNTKTDFMLHVMTAHPTIYHPTKGGKVKKITECHICNKSFPGHSALLRHINYHTRVNQIQCKLCEKTVATKDHLPLHMDRYHPELYQKILQLYPKKSTGFTCEYCGEKFPGRYKLETHRRVHEMYQCPLCPTRLQTTDSMRKHLDLHVENGYPGDIASIMPEKKTLIPKFEPEHKEKMSKGDLIASLMETDFKEVFMSTSINKQGGEGAPSQMVLNEETGETEAVIKCHTEKAVVEASPTDLLKAYVKKYKDQFGKKKGRKKSSKKSYVCDICNKIMPTLSKLRRHMNSHTGQHRVKCRLCRKSICNKDHLDVHMRRKHPEMSSRINRVYAKKQAGFVCPGCDKKFPCRSKLERHMKVHNKAYQCSMCVSRFHSTVGLRRHLSQHSETGGEIQDLEAVLANSQIEMVEDPSNSLTKSKGDWIMELMQNNFKELPDTDDESNAADDDENLDHMELDDHDHDDNIETSDKEDKHEIPEVEENNMEEDNNDKVVEAPPSVVECCDDVKFDVGHTTAVRPEAFACNFCSKEFVLHHELKQHVLNHITVKMFECDTCHETFSTRKWIQIHATQCIGQNRLRTSCELTISCGDCDIYFENSFDQVNHQKLFHEDFDSIKEEAEEVEDISNSINSQNELTDVRVNGDEHKVEEFTKVTCKEEVNPLQSQEHHSGVQYSRDVIH